MKILVNFGYCNYVEVPAELFTKVMECKLYKEKDWRDNTFEISDTSPTVKVIHDKSVLEKPSPEILNMQEILGENNRLTRLVESLQETIEKLSAKNTGTDLQPR